MATETQQRPPQQQDHQPGLQSQMNPTPQIINPGYKPSGKLRGKVALITGGDSGIGQAVAYMYAQEGANVAISYLEEHTDAAATEALVRQAGSNPLLMPGDISQSDVCDTLIEKTIATFGKLDILICNAAQQHVQKTVETISDEQLDTTMRVNLFSQFYLIRAALPHLKAGSSIILTTSVVAYQGLPTIVDYAATKGAQVAMIYSLSTQLAERQIRVNGVAPGPIWTPLIPSSFDPQKVAEFGSDTPMKRAGQPCEVAPAYVFLASEADASYISGQVIHVNGGRITGG
jgi:NAD(P)-dependent dehydrogenase (short-subunit alcohol dehydrogenase family)